MRGARGGVLSRPAATSCLPNLSRHNFCAVQKVIAVEGLDLTGVEPGWYHQICLPAKLQGSDGAPIRCLLQPLAEGGGGHSEL